MALGPLVAPETVLSVLSARSRSDTDSRGTDHRPSLVPEAGMQAGGARSACSLQSLFAREVQTQHVLR